ncbi:hypothetical protein V8E36_002373 [Tilletia maclaganii]
MKAKYQQVPSGYVAAPCGILDMAGNEKAAVVTKIVFFDQRLDAEHMHTTFYNLLRAWPFLGSRIRRGHGELRELWSVHVPTPDKLEDLIRADQRQRYTVSKMAVPLFSTADRTDESIFDVMPFTRFAQNTDRLPQHSPSFATIDRERMMQDFTSPYGVKKMEEYFTRDAGIFTAHLCDFRDGAGFTFTVPHACFDGAGAKVALEAYVRLLRGEPIGELPALGYDPFLRYAPDPYHLATTNFLRSPLSSTSTSSSRSHDETKHASAKTKSTTTTSSSSSSEPAPPAQWYILSLMSLLVLCYHIAKDCLLDRPEKKMNRVMIYLPRGFIEGIKEQAKKEIVADHGQERLQALRLSRANALHAWILQNELARRVDIKPDRLTTHGTLANMRFRLPSGLDSIHPKYFSNCLVPIVAPLTTTRQLASRTLGQIAYDVRVSLLEQSTPQELEKYIRWQAWRGTPVGMGGGLQKTGMACFFPVQARFTLVTDWTKFGLWELDWCGAVLSPSSAARSADSASEKVKNEVTATPAGTQEAAEDLILSVSPPKDGSDSSSTMTAASPQREPCTMLALIGDAHTPMHHRNGWIMVGGRDGGCWVLGTVSDQERVHPRGWGRFGDAAAEADTPEGFLSVPCGSLDLANNEKLALVTMTFFLPRPVDADHMRSSFYTLLRSWPYLSARLRKGKVHRELWRLHVPNSDKLEELIQADQRLASDPASHKKRNIVPMFSERDCTQQSLDDHFPYAKFGRQPFERRPKSPVVIEIDRNKLLGTCTSPLGLQSLDQCFVRDASIFGLHVARFADGAALSFTVPHVCYDAAGFILVLKAYANLLKDGTAPASPPPLGYDPYSDFAPSPQKEGGSIASGIKGTTISDHASAAPSPPAGWRLLSLVELSVLVFYFALDLLWYRPERRMKRIAVYIPADTVAEIKEQARADIEDPKLAASISTGSALHAWIVKNDLAYRVEVEPNRLATSATLAEMRYRRPLGPSEVHPQYLGNCLVPIATEPMITRELAKRSLGQLALDTRTALLKKVEPAALADFVRWQTWRSTPPERGGGHRPNSMAVFFPPSANFSIITDWTGVGLFELDFSGAYVARQQEGEVHGEEDKILAIVVDAHTPLHHRNAWTIAGGRNGERWLLGSISDTERAHPGGWGRFADAKFDEAP